MIGRERKMPKMPITQIDFGGEKYTVKSVDNLSVDGTTLSGHIKHGQHTIELDIQECIGQQTCTLMHECIHYMLMAHGYADRIVPDCKEGLIDTIAIGMITLIKRNPNLIGLIQEQV